MEEARGGLSYSQAGVDIAAGAALVQKLRQLVKTTSRPGADTELGGFGGVFDLGAAGLHDPVLVAGTDGVGTKLRIAIDSGMCGTLGIDLVAMCVNDILAQGAEPLFFLDYFACARLEPELALSVMGGVVAGCKMAGCALIGGETAEMPGLYRERDFDLAGFAVGAAARTNLLPRRADMQAGDALVALAASGPHSNGYSLIREVVRRTGLAWGAPAPFAPERTLAEAFLEPTRIYIKALLPLIRARKVKALAHITGGGLEENLPRMLPEHLSAHLDEASWTPPPVFSWLEKEGRIAPGEMRRTFNCGIGMMAVVEANLAHAVADSLNAAGERAWIAGVLAS